MGGLITEEGFLDKVPLKTVFDTGFLPLFEGVRKLLVRLWGGGWTVVDTLRVAWNGGKAGKKFS